MENMVKRWFKNRINYIHLSYDDLYDFDNFVIKLLEHLKGEQQYSLLLKINFNKDRYAMVGDQIGFIYENSDNLEVFEGLYETLVERLSKTLDNYDVDRIDSFQILYVLIEDLPELKLKNVNKVGFNKEFSNVKDTKNRFNFIPLTVDMNYFGKLVISDRSGYLDRINKQRNILSVGYLIIGDEDKMYLYQDSLIILNRKDSSNKDIIHRGVYNAKSGNLIDEVIDTVISDSLFIRQIGNVSLTISDNNVVKVASKKVLSPIKFKSKSLKDEANPFIGSWDVEAFDDIDGYAKVYALGFAVLGKGSKMYYLDKNISSEELVLKCLNDMLINEYNGYIFYTHNFGKYDSIFLMKILKEENIRLGYEHYKTNDISRDGKMLKLTIKVKRDLSTRKASKIGARKDPGYNTITIVDSLNLLNQSLYKLAVSFEVPVLKGNFPYSFVKRETLNYIGNTPDYKYWEKISLEDYSKLVRPDWNLKDECLNYLDKDLTSLVMIMNKFSEYINRKYYLQVTDSLTISRLALNIFLKDYLKDSKLPIINKAMFHDIKQAYYGGVTEVYKPYGSNLYHYDVNSLYPFASLNPIPGLDCVYIENIGNSRCLNDLFGYFYCEIKTGNNYLGLLPVHHKKGMIMPNGTWKGWYFSEELKFASENGYTINVIRGYSFNKVNDVFTDYVKDLYHIKSSTKDRVEKDIAKRLLNHLLGRFGLNIVKPTTKCVDSKELSLLFSTKKIIGKPDRITDNDFRVTYINQIDKDICEKHGIDYIKVQKLSVNTDMEKFNEFRDVSLTTAAAVTAYARVYMSKIKLNIINKGGNIYYTDTDSIVTDIPLDENLIGNELGKFKLEYRIKEGYYISNKTYGIDLADKIVGEDGKEVSYIIKSKAVSQDSLNLDSFKGLYHGDKAIATKRSAIRDYFKGSVRLVSESVELKHDSYTKRDKIFRRGVWVDTKPLVLNEGLELEKKKYKSKNVKWNTLKCNSLLNFLKPKLYKLLILILVVTFSITGIEYDSYTTDINYYTSLDETIDLKYNDDYMEEPVEVEYYINDKAKSWFSNFFDLFKDRSSYTNRINKYSDDLPVYLDTGNYITEGLDTHYIERPPVLNTVLKQHLDSLYDELSTLKDDYSLAEFKRLHADNTLSDVLILCDKALCGSPITGVDSPILDRTSAFRNTPNLHLYTSFENTPNLVRDSPILSKIRSPLLVKDSPLLSRISSPFLGEDSSLLNSGSPYLDKDSLFKTSTNLITKDEGLLIDTVNSAKSTLNTITDTDNKCDVTPRKYPIRNEVSHSVLKRYGNIWPAIFNIESPSTIKRYGWTSPTGNSVLEDHSPLAKRHGHLFPETFTLKKDYHVITEHNNIYKAYSPYKDVD